MVTCRRLKERDVDIDLDFSELSSRLLIQADNSEHTSPAVVLRRCPLLHGEMSVDKGSGSRYLLRQGLD